MKIVVEGIPSAGREIVFGSKDAWAAEAAGVAMDRAPDQFAGQVTLKRASQKGVVVVDVRAEARAQTMCDRCGEACERVSKPEVRLLYAPEERGTEAYDGGELELEADDLELGWYTDGELDLGDVLREALTLALPSRTTCADTEGCDKRTDALLGASRAASDPFAVLKGWKPGTGEG